jgi:hypothetical protein
MLSGRRPHDAPSYEDYVVKVRTERPPPLASVAPHVPPALADVIDRGLARDRDARWPSAAAFADALSAAMMGASIPPMAPSTHVSAPPPLAARTPPPPPPMPAPSSRWPVVALAFGGFAILVALGIAAAAFLNVRSQTQESAAPPTAASATATAAAPAPATATAAAPATASATAAVSPVPVPVPVPVPAPTASTSTATPSAKPAPSPVGGVTVSSPRTVGKVKVAVLDDLVARAMPSLPKCRRLGHAETVVIQVFVQSEGEVSMVEPYVAENKGDVETARCVATRFLDASQHGWTSQGGQGIVRYTVTLDPR